MKVMYFMLCTDPDLVRGLTLSLLAQAMSISAPTVEVAVVSTPDKCSSERRDLDLALTFFMTAAHNSSYYQK